MARVTYDDRSFMLDGKRIWLVSGSVPYFRIPSPLWRDRLLKAKRAGLNCITTCVPWNYHELAEGKWDLSGDRDIVAFVRLAEELGLYVILAPGPYIDADWDFGGLPPWLRIKPGMVYRTNNAAFMHYFDKYFRQMLPRLAELQVTRDGNILLVQSENEFLSTTMPDRLGYLGFISQLLRRSGFEIPIITCNGLTEPPVQDAIESAGGVEALDAEIAQLKHLRRRQPNAPLLVMKHRAGSPLWWGGQRPQVRPRDVARRALETLGCGAQLNYQPWHGGTNFGFWAGRLDVTDTSWQISSYDCGAPLAEGGGPTETYYLTRLVNMLAGSMGSFFAGCTIAESGVTIRGNGQVLNLSGREGNWAIITNNGQDEVRDARISLPSGRELSVSLEVLGATAVPVGLRLNESCALDYSNLMPLGLFGQKLLVLHGPAGWEGLFAVNGKEYKVEVPGGREPHLVEPRGVTVAVVSSELAQRTYPADEDGSVLFGLAEPPPSVETAMAPPGVRQVAAVNLQGERSSCKLPNAGGRKAQPPKLESWKRLAVCTEPVSAELAWTGIGGPMDVDKLGFHHGYCWYRVDLDVPEAGKRRLLLPQCADRAIVYLNGQLIGTWGRGDGATRKPMPAGFKSGRNTLTLLVDNLGRYSSGPRLGEPKGLFGHIYEAGEFKVKKPVVKAADGFPANVLSRQQQYLMGELNATPLRTIDVEFALKAVAPVFLTFDGLPNHVAVLCNQRPVEFLACGQGGRNYGEVLLNSELAKGRNLVRLLVWGDPPENPSEAFQFQLLAENLSAAASWSCRPWTIPGAGGPVVGKDRPAWYTTSFKCDGAVDGLFLHVVGASKGQIYLNRHNVGRFWSIGPQQEYYLPSCWLARHNELLVFDEHGEHTGPVKPGSPRPRPRMNWWLRLLGFSALDETDGLG